MKISSFFKKIDSWLTIAIVIGIFLAVNFFSYQIFYRWDLTQNKDFSISKASKTLVGNLDDLINIKLYFSRDLPSQYVNLRQEVGDILDEYANYSDNKIKIDFIDPNTLENPEQEMYMMSIPALQFNVLEKDKYQVVRGYLGAVVQYGDKKETIPVIDSTGNLEYRLTTAIKKVTSENMATVAFLTSNGSADVGVISAVYQKVQELYNVDMVDLSVQKNISDEIDTLIIVDPKESFSEEQLKAIDDFLMKGKSAMFLLNKINLEDNLSASVNDNSIFDLLENYGVKINNDLVLDYSSGVASFNSGFFTFSTNYPFWPKVTTKGFDSDNAAVAKLESLVLPWASSLEILTDKIDQNNKISTLAKSGAKAWVQEENFDLNPQQQFNPNQKVGEKKLAVSIFGKFNSPYSENSTDKGRIIVVGDADFIGDNFLGQYGENILFFQNLVDSLSLDEDLINIRSKGVTDRPIKELTEAQKIFIKFLNILGVTIVVVLFGLVRYFMRRRSKFADEL